MRRIFAFLPLLALCACVAYHSPARDTWPRYLAGASFTDMTDVARIAKKPVFLGAGGRLVSDGKIAAKYQYGDKSANDTAIATNYMAGLEMALYNALRKPGISVQRAGTDVGVILVRDAIMAPDVADISGTGADTLKKIAKILREYDATFIEIAGYTDQMRDANAARALSTEMASRTAVFLSQNRISTARMFIVGRGAARPIAAQDDIGRLTNRRVELRITPAR